MTLLLVMLAAYVLGSISMGYVVVRLFTGRDVRQVGSGRTGGTNAMRAAGLSAGLLTALLDGLKGAFGVWLAQFVLPPNLRPLGMALAGLCVILGHNYSVFLKFKGGAGGAPCVGGAFGLWPWSLLIILPIGVFVWLGIGYASVATLAVSLMITAVFAYRAFVLHAPGAYPEFVLYGVGAFFLLLWTLRPNLRRLMRGEERVVGWRARRFKQAQLPDSSSESRH
jgi:glycerol-3-phosphate acyltransferase PlsY